MNDSGRGWLALFGMFALGLILGAGAVGGTLMGYRLGIHDERQRPEAPCPPPWIIGPQPLPTLPPPMLGPAPMPVPQLPIPAVCEDRQPAKLKATCDCVPCPCVGGECGSPVCPARESAPR